MSRHASIRYTILILFSKLLRNFYGAQQFVCHLIEKALEPPHQLVFSNDSEASGDSKLPKICRGVFLLGAWYVAPQGLSHSVSIPCAAAHAAPSRVARGA